MLDNFWLIPLGLFAGAYGALIGAGGGFILVPVLLILFPNEAPEIVTSISLMVVFLNALSGTIAYARSNRIDYKIGMIFSLATMPGAVLGACHNRRKSRPIQSIVRVSVACNRCGVGDQSGQGKRYPNCAKQ
jgi:uncharacterized membrane protein YfcA